MERLLIIGCGDIARRAIPELRKRYRLSALVRPSAEPNPLAAEKGQIISGDLDFPESLTRLAGAADRLVHLAPPEESGACDLRTRQLLAALGETRAMLPRRFVYMSTSGVYGDCGGAWVDEDRPVHPETERAARRADAERAIAEWGGVHGIEIVILRAPGIYAAGRLPLDRLKRGTPVLCTEDDVYTNHIHADDLAAILVAAVERPGVAGTYNASDDTELKMGDWFDLVADRFGLERPRRVARAQAAGQIPPALLSFMRESRRLVNRRMKERLGITLAYPTVFEGMTRLAAAA